MLSGYPAVGCELRGDRTAGQPREKKPVPWELTQLACHFPTVLGSPEGSNEVWGQMPGTQVETAAWAPEGKLAPA